MQKQSESLVTDTGAAEGATDGARGVTDGARGATCGELPAAPHGTHKGGASSVLGGVSPGGGRFENVSNARVGTLLCLVDVRGEACMCSRRFGACTVQGEGNSA